MVVAGAKPLSGQAAVEPVQVSATSHGPAASRHVVAGAGAADLAGLGGGALGGSEVVDMAKEIERGGWVSGSWVCSEGVDVLDRHSRGLPALAPHARGRARTPVAAALTRVHVPAEHLPTAQRVSGHSASEVQPTGGGGLLPPIGAVQLAVVRSMTTSHTPESPQPASPPAQLVAVGPSAGSTPLQALLPSKRPSWSWTVMEVAPAGTVKEASRTSLHLRGRGAWVGGGRTV